MPQERNLLPSTDKATTRGMAPGDESFNLFSLGMNVAVPNNQGIHAIAAALPLVSRIGTFYDQPKTCWRIA